MKSVVITGSAGGFGLEMARIFRKNNFSVMLSDINETSLEKAKKELQNIEAEGKIETLICDVTKTADLENLWKVSLRKFKQIDIWINNAGVNQPDKPVCELTESDIDFLLSIDLKGTINGSRIAFAGMLKQGFGQIYNVEGYGSNDAMMPGLTIYGTAKRAVTYFTKSLAKESKKLYKNTVKVCRLTPGIMITNFLTNANGGKTQVKLSEKTKKVYNILGDYPSTIAEFVVPKMIKNKKNDRNIVWLTNSRAFGRFLTAGFKKHDYFE